MNNGRKKITLQKSKAKLKPYNSPPLQIRGKFRAKIESRKHTTTADIYVAASTNVKSVLSKYSRFDMNMLQISVEELTNAPDKKEVPEIQHLSYIEMSKYLTTEREINQKLQRLKEPIQSEAQVNEMIGKYPKVFQGIGCHKYRQIKLNIDPTVTPKIQPQRKIPVAKRGPLD